MKEVWSLIQLEGKKCFWNKKLLVAFVILFSFFLYVCVTQRATINYGGELSSNASQFDAMEMNVQVKEDMLQAYQRYVDEHLLPEEALREQAAKQELSYEEFFATRYDFFNKYIFMEEADAVALEPVLIAEKYFASMMKEDIVNICINQNQQGADPGEIKMSDHQLAQLTKLAQTNLERKPLIKGYSLGFDYLTSNMQFLPFLLGGLLVIASYGLFSFEKVKKTDALILTSKLGKREAIFSKLAVVFFFASAAWLVFQLGNLLVCWGMFSLKGGNVSIFSESFPSPYGYTYLTYYLYQLVISYFGTLLLAFLICFVSQLTRPIPTLCLGLIFVLFTSLLQTMAGNETFSPYFLFTLLMPTQMMSAFTTFRQYVAYAIADFNILLPHMQYGILIIGIPTLVTLTYQLAKHRQIKN